MGGILALLLGLISSAAFAATPGNAPILTIAAPGQNSQSLSIPLSSLSGTGVNGVFSLYMGQGVTGGDFYILYKNGVAYQVPSGKSAYCFNVTAGDSTTGLFQLASATASFSNGAASITGGVYQCGVSGVSCLAAGPTAYVAGAVSSSYVFASNTFPAVDAANGGTLFVHMDCFEQ
jgi:hypothetical protein